MVASHFSTSSASHNAPVSLDAPQPPVLIEAVGALRKIVLNRPKALNSITKEMTELILPAVEKFEASELANVILIKGNGKHFCAGGDVVALTKHLENEADLPKASDFFVKEYTLNHLLATTPKPIVSIMHGVCFGGGNGLAGHGAFRIATESTQIAMPETKIGLFPDVGANFFLPRLDGQLGLYLGLTSFPLKGAATYLAGLATHYVPSERLEALETRLAELDASASTRDVNAAIEEFSADADELQASLKNYPLVGPLRRAIDSIFSLPTAEEIVAALEKLENGSLDLSRIIRSTDGEVDVSALQAWARETREAILLRSPTSVKLTIKGIREGAKMTLDEVLQTDARIAAACCSTSVHPDFKTGVTDLLIKKIKPEEQRPAWSPSTLEEVSDDKLQQIFFSNKPPFTSPPLPNLSFKKSRRARPTALAPFYVSPHARFALPRERDVEKVVKGEDAGSDDYAVTKEEVVERLSRRWNGKVGVKEKVEEVLSRRTVEGEQKTLNASLASMDAAANDEVWSALLAWLAAFPGGTDPERYIRLVHNAAGRGLVARGDVAPNTLLISIPNAALLNLRTLKPLYPPAFHSKLNAVQWLSLHLALEFRRHLFSPTPPKPTKASTRDYWPFIATLPRSFETVPLTWAVNSLSLDTLRAEYAIPNGDVSLKDRAEREKQPGPSEREKRRRKRFADLCGLLPPAVRRRQADVEKRFRKDWVAAKEVWAKQDEVDGELAFFDFLLGWLNVNTRCLYFEIDSKKEDNLTLAPVVDMINHIPGRTTKPSPRISTFTFSSPPSTSPDPPLKDGDELAFSYGPHEDTMLLTEYGFVIGRVNDYNAVEVDRFVEGLFEAQGREGELKMGVLKDEGYWGDMTLQATPEPPSASWRVLVALRLLHLRLPSSLTLSAEALAPWYNVLTGVSETISSANELKVVATLKSVCKSVAAEAEEGLKRCAEVRRRWEKEKEGDEDLEMSLGMLETVWEEEERIAKAVEEECGK
ncbi:hypothetical protein JCM10207_001011 [Rhodosporidiobolus poonsookiae]